MLELGLAHPLFRQRVCPPAPGTKGGGAHSPAGEGLGESQFLRLEKSLALCLLCAFQMKIYFRPYFSTRKDGFSAEMVPYQRPYFLVSTRIRPQLKIQKWEVLNRNIAGSARLAI
jgi:hypothetical protein